MLSESIRNTQSKTTASKPKKPRKQATKPTGTAPAAPVVGWQGENAPTPMTDAQRLEALSNLSPDDSALFAELVAKLEAGEPVEQTREWFEAAQAAQKPTPAPEPVELGADEIQHALLQLAVPLALTIFKNILDPLDVFTGKYNLNDTVDYLMDELPAALNGCDHVALIKFLDQ